jgi:myosin-5
MYYLRNIYNTTTDCMALPPHVFAASARAYRRLCQRREDQTIVVSGESGAGKTETIKLLVKHIVHLSQPTRPKELHKVSSYRAATGNLLLETFG